MTDQFRLTMGLNLFVITASLMALFSRYGENWIGLGICGLMGAMVMFCWFYMSSPKPPTQPKVTKVVFYLPSGRRITAEEIESLIEKVERLEV